MSEGTNFRKYFNWKPGTTLGDGTYIPPRPPQADSTWVITPSGWRPPPTLNELVKMLPVPLWRRVWSKIYCWYYGL